MSADDIAHGETLARSGKYTPTASPNGPVDTIPPPTEPDEPPDPGPPDDQADDEATWWEKAVKNRAVQYKIEREARQRVDDEMRPAVHYPPVRPLTAMLAEHFGSRPATASTRWHPPTARIMLSRSTRPAKPPWSAT